MRILVAHTSYQQAGGEDECVSAEVDSLRRRGHVVDDFQLSNHSIDGMDRALLVANTFWNRDAYKHIHDCIQEKKPDILHVHNTFPLMSPSVYYAAKRHRVPVVQTLHNFRLCCPKAVLYREGKTCELCLGRVAAWPALVHRCYRGSLGATGVAASMFAAHRLLGTWTRAVSLYVTPTEFCRRKLIEGGLPEAKMRVKANNLGPDPGPGDGRGGFALYVGRLSEEKGIDTLLGAWSRLSSPIRLKVVGDGPLAPLLRKFAETDHRVDILGKLPLPEVQDLMGQARVLICPSRCFETFARVVGESYAKGTPVLASRIGAMVENVVDGVTGRFFTPGDEEGLVAQIESMFGEPEWIGKARHNSRAYYESRFAEDSVYRAQLAIYEEVLDQRQAA